MLTQQQPPRVSEVTQCDYRYQSFFAPLVLTAGDTSPSVRINMPQAQAILKQAFYILDQHELGHVALACPPRAAHSCRNAQPVAGARAGG